MNKKKLLAFVVIFLLALPLAFALDISNLRVTDINHQSAVVRWETNVAADSLVEYGTDEDNLGLSEGTNAESRQHHVVLAGLSASTTYFVTASSENDVDTVSEDASFETTASDTTVPRIAVAIPPIVNQQRINIIGETEEGVDVNLFVNDQLVWSYLTTNGLIEVTNVRLNTGDNVIRIDAVDRAANVNTAEFTVLVDLVGPEIDLVKEPPRVTSEPEFVLEGEVGEKAFVTIVLNEDVLFEKETVGFAVQVRLDEGNNTLVINATDSAGNTDVEDYFVELDTTPPQLDDVQPFEDNVFYYEGRASDTVKGSTEPGADVYVFVEGLSGLQASALDGGSFSAFFSSAREPTKIDEVLELAQYTAKADDEGKFEIEDVNFQHPFGGTLEGFAPEEVQPGVPGLVGERERALSQASEYSVDVVVVAVDKVGLVGFRPYSVGIGNCFSGTFDFDIHTLEAYQHPTLLNPAQLDAGTALISFVLHVNYTGRASNNVRDPEAAQLDDDFYEILGVDLDPACRRSEFWKRDPSYKYACQLIKTRPTLQRAMNPQGTNWYVSYNLAKTDGITDFDEEFWEELLENEMRFPFQVHVNYREKLIGEEEQPSQLQTVCRDVAYVVDVPIEPKEILPDWLLKDGQEVINDTLEVIDEVMPKLDQIIQYAGVGCVGTYGLRTAAQVWRRLITYWNFVDCNVRATAGDECPVTQEQLEACFYVTEGKSAFTSAGQQVPYPDEWAGLGTDKADCAKVFQKLVNSGSATGSGAWVPPTNKKADLLESPLAGQFSATAKAWALEAGLYESFRFLCDRVFCKAAPAGWTQQADLEAIKQTEYNAQECRAKATSVRRLTRIENCLETLKRDNIEPDLAPDYVRGPLFQDTCYTLGTVSGDKGPSLYVVHELKADECGVTKDELPVHQLKRIDKYFDPLKVDGSGAPQLLCAIKEGDDYSTYDSRSCQEVCTARLGKGAKTGCFEATDAEREKGWWAAGGTKDCWEGFANGKDGFSSGEYRAESGRQCQCQSDLTSEVKTDKEKVEEKGAVFAGKEIGADEGVEIGATLPTEDNPGNWPWNYREAQIYESSKGKRGIYYPTERYYSGRDFPTTFGMDYWLDYLRDAFGFSETTPVAGTIGSAPILGNRFRAGFIDPKRSPVVDGKTQHIGALQTACLTGIRGRLGIFREILVGAQRCLGEIQKTGQADAGFCKEVLSQYVCNLASSIFTMFTEDQCTPGTPALQRSSNDGALAYILPVFSSIGETVESTKDDLHREYGNAALDQYLEGGGQDLTKKVCMAAFGVDVGFDMDSFMDVAYTTSFKTSASVFSSEGAKGRREFMTFNPQPPFNGVFEYRTSYQIYAGCSLESYKVELAAVTRNEGARFSNINCGEVNNREPGSFNGCDNWEGKNEITADFDSGGLVTQGSFVDKPVARVVNKQPYRFDHIKITLHADPRHNAEECFETENRQGKSGVFYFPIHDSTAKDVLQCDVKATGQFLCNIGELTGLTQSYIEDVQCFDPATNDYKRCDRVELSVEDEDPVKVRAKIYSSGEGKICVQANVRTHLAEILPKDSGRRLIELPSLGGATQGITPMDLRILEKLDEETFKGTGGIFIVQDPAICSPVFDSNQNDAKQHTSTTNVAIFDFGGSAGKYTLTFKGGGNVVLSKAPSGFTKDGNKLKKTDDKFEFTEAELRQIEYLINGYHVKNVAPTAAGQCSFRAVAAASFIPNDQIWKLNIKLFYPDATTNQCTVASSNSRPIPAQSALAYDVEKSIDIRVRKSRVSDALTTAYNLGLKAYGDAVKAQDVAKKKELYRRAVSEFSAVRVAAPPEGARQEFLAYWWSVVAMARLHNLEEHAEKQNIKNAVEGTVDNFAARLDHPKVKENDQLLNTAEFRLVKEYTSQVGLAVTGVGTLRLATQKPDTSNGASVDSSACLDCNAVHDGWKQLRDLTIVKNNNKIMALPSGFFNPTSGTWGPRPAGSGAGGAGGSGVSAIGGVDEGALDMSDQVGAECRYAGGVCLSPSEVARYIQQDSRCVVKESARSSCALGDACCDQSIIEAEIILVVPDDELPVVEPTPEVASEPEQAALLGTSATILLADGGPQSNLRFRYNYDRGVWEYRTILTSWRSVAVDPTTYRTEWWRNILNSLMQKTFLSGATILADKAAECGRLFSPSIKVFVADTVFYDRQCNQYIDADEVARLAAKSFSNPSQVCGENGGICVESSEIQQRGCTPVAVGQELDCSLGTLCCNQNVRPVGEGTETLQNQIFFEADSCPASHDALLWFTEDNNALGTYWAQGKTRQAVANQKFYLCVDKRLKKTDGSYPLYIESNSNGNTLQATGRVPTQCNRNAGDVELAQFVNDLDTWAWWPDPESGQTYGAGSTGPFSSTVFICADKEVRDAQVEGNLFFSGGVQPPASYCQQHFMFDLSGDDYYGSSPNRRSWDDDVITAYFCVRDVPITMSS